MGRGRPKLGRLKTGKNNCRQAGKIVDVHHATILSNLLAYRESIGDTEGVAQLRKVSLIAWQHINLHGRYEFTKI